MTEFYFRSYSIGFGERRLSPGWYNLNHERQGRVQEWGLQAPGGSEQRRSGKDVPGLLRGRAEAIRRGPTVAERLRAELWVLGE